MAGRTELIAERREFIRMVHARAGIDTTRDDPADRYLRECLSDWYGEFAVVGADPWRIEAYYRGVVESILRHAEAHQDDALPPIIE